MMLLLLARLINRQVEVFRGFGRRSPYVVAMVARCRVDSLYVLTKDSAVTGAHLCLVFFLSPLAMSVRL